jgi:hypothetical protein
MATDPSELPPWSHDEAVSRFISVLAGVLIPTAVYFLHARTLEQRARAWNAIKESLMLTTLTLFFLYPVLEFLAVIALPAWRSLGFVMMALAIGIAGMIAAMMPVSILSALSELLDAKT